MKEMRSFGSASEVEVMAVVDRKDRQGKVEWDTRRR
jgi:hypothetical protein